MHRFVRRRWPVGFSFLLLAAAAAAQQFGPYAERPGVAEFTGRMLVRLGPGDPGQRAAAAAFLDPWRLRAYPEIDEHLLQVPDGWDESTFAAMLGATGLFQYAQPDWRLAPQRTPNDPLYGSQWQHAAMHSALGWDWHTGAGDVIVAVVDSGIELLHPDLQAALVSGYNSATDREQAQGANVNDTAGHGTAVAGCAGAIGDNGIGVAGVGWNLKLMPVRALGPLGIALSDALEGARWAVEHGAKVINSSNGQVADPSVETTGAYVRQQGGLLFWAAGNDGGRFPRDEHPSVIVVGATDPQDRRASFSNYGPLLDLAAPGADIFTTMVTSGGGYLSFSGTSFATPMAAGVAAMIWSVNPWLAPEQVEARLYASCDDLGPPGEDDEFGHGRVNLARAMQLAATGDLALTATPLQAGLPARLTAGAATATDLVWFLFSRDGIAATRLDSLRTAVGLAAPKLAGAALANGHGYARLEVVVPMRAAGRTVWLQAVQRQRSSNLIELLIP